MQNFISACLSITLALTSASLSKCLWDIRAELAGIREELHSARVAQEQTCEVGDE
jgi:hypothetical protein